MDTISETLAHAILGLVFSPSSRTFWPFLIGATVVAVLAKANGTFPRLRPEQRLFSKATWFCRSALNDYGLVIFNSLIIVTSLSPYFPNDQSNIALVVGSITQNLPQLAHQSQWWAPILLAACLFIADDFIRFIVHYCEHRIPALWELHKVHHSATVLNFLTAERQHPLSIMIFQFAVSFGVLIVNASFILLIGDKISPTALWGSNIFWIVTNMIGGTLRHSPVWVSFGPRIENWLISPAQHQIHHSDDPRHFDRNFGGSLAIWDRMFGTLYVTSSTREDIKFGLGSETRFYESLWDLYCRPLHRIIGFMKVRKGVVT